MEKKPVKKSPNNDQYRKAKECSAQVILIDENGKKQFIKI